jgi:membrane protease YdiL (CAAX protease family)
MVLTSFASLLLVFFGGFEIHGIVPLLSSLVGLAFIWFIFRSEFVLSDIFDETRAIPRKVLINAFVVLIAIQPIFQLLGQGISEGFNLAGYHISFSPVGSGGTSLLFIFLNSALVGPVTEEILFRGVILKVLSRYGRNFAIVASAVLFGLYHTDFLQILHSFACGLVLAYITFRYSLKWSIVLHCAHNLLLLIVQILYLPWFFTYSFFSIFVIWGAVILIKKRTKISRFLRKSPAMAHAYNYFFTVPMIVIYIALALAFTFVKTDIIPLSELTPPPNPNIPRI